MKICNKTRFFGMLGFAMRAGKISTGTDIICKELPKGEILLVVVSSLASEPTKKRIRNKCEFYQTECVEADVMPDELSQKLGKLNTTVCIAVKDEAFKREILKCLV